MAHNGRPGAHLPSMEKWSTCYWKRRENGIYSVNDLGDLFVPREVAARTLRRKLEGRTTREAAGLTSSSDLFVLSLKEGERYMSGCSCGCMLPSAQ